MKNNYLHVMFPALAQNEGLARIMVSSFAAALDPTMDELADIKTAVSEAVTNCALHAYPDGDDGVVVMKLYFVGEDTLHVEIIDEGVGIPNLEEAMEPLYTSRPDLERSGMGFSFMDALMDSLEVRSEVGKGTTVIMTKTIER